jgi:sodium/potassium/calcium exchanger 6
VWAIVIGVLVAFFLNQIYKQEKNKNWLQWTILALNMVCAILWLSTAAGTIVDLIEVPARNKFTSTVLQMNPVVLGASFMAIGNSLGDFYNNSSLSSIGLAVMACTGTISGQVFNLLFGLGINLLRQTWRMHGTGKVDTP